jgi:putative IMPACT (imprinted ancient) family translation regulator
MVRAYTLAAQTVLAQAELCGYHKMITIQFKSDYSSVQKIAYLLDQSSISDIKREFLTDAVLWDITSDQESLDDFRQRADRLLDSVQQ